MKKLLLFIASIFLISGVSHAQILNGGFENWSADGPNCNSPDNWGTINGSTGLVNICTVQQETVDVHSGSSSLKLTTEQVIIPPVINEIAPGICTSGTINTQTEAVEGGHAFTDQPAAFSFWYKASPVNNDTYSFEALLIDEVSGDTVGYAEASNNVTVNTYTEVTADVLYFSATPPTLLQITLLPSDPDNPQVGSTLWIDDIMSVGDITSISEVESKSVTAFPNPTSDMLNFSLKNEKPVVVSIFDVVGQKVEESYLNRTNNNISLKHLPNGSYFWMLNTVDGDVMKSGKVLIAK